MIEIESVKRLDIKPGEILAVRCHRALSAQDVDTLRQQIEQYLPDGVKALILANDVELTVLSQADQDLEGGIERQAGNLPHPPTFTPPPARQASTTERPIG